MKKENVKIESFSTEGKGIARIDGKVIFVEDAVSQDVCDIDIFKNKKDYALAKILEISEPSPMRSLPYCEHYEYCGGCRLQHVHYDAQLQLKRQSVIDAFKHIGHLENLPEIPAALASPQTQYYRNKLEYTFSNKIFRTEGQELANENALGFHVSGVFNKVLDIYKCYHQADLSNEIRNELRNFCIEKKLNFYDLKLHNGLMRNLIIRNTSTQEWMVVVVFANEDTLAIQDVMSFLKHKFPQITSLQYIINHKKNDTIFDQEIITYHGKNYITENLNGLSFRITAKSFFQVNIFHTQNLYEEVKKQCNLKPTDVIYDLYCGTGTIGLYLSKNAKTIIGIELIEDAIDIARQNAELNHIENAHFISGDMKDVFNQNFYQNHGHPDIIILDPPRAGLHKNVVEQLLQIGCERIVYVSCNPETQARDLSMLKNDYEITSIQPVDMFPMTLHLENVVSLQKIKP